MEDIPLTTIMSPRSVATKKVDGELPNAADGVWSAMECEPDCTASTSTKEMPSFLPSLVIECLGYPDGLAAMLACRTWRGHGERIFCVELTELRGVCEGTAEYLRLPPSTKSTISIAFSPDNRRFASTHGDHTVKIVDFGTGSVVATLRGHPRTPWTVKFHPTEPDVVASGCLGFEARVWCISEERCIRRAEFDRAIISLSFHPSGEFLAIAAGTYIYLWQYASGAAPQREFGHPHPIRCLRFLPESNAIVVGASNGVPSETRHGEGQGAGAMDDPQPPVRQRATFKLMLCDLDLEAARIGVRQQLGPADSADEARRRLSSADSPVLVPVAGTGLAISKEPRCVLRHALFYNDGGFDISPCGKFLCSCAELWLARKEDIDEDQGEVEQDGEMSPSRVAAATWPAARWRATSREMSTRRDASVNSAWWPGRRASTVRPLTPPTAKRDAVRIDTESVAPSGLCGAIMRPLLLDESDDGTSRRRSRETPGHEASGTIDERGTMSSSESETSSPRRRRRFTTDPPQGRARPRSVVAPSPRLSRRDQQRIQQQLTLQEHLRLQHVRASETANVRRPSLPTPRRMVDRNHGEELRQLPDDSPLDSAASSDEGHSMNPPRRQWRAATTRPTRRRRRIDLANLNAAPVPRPVSGKYKPHLVVVSLADAATNPANGESEGRILQATALDDHSFLGAGGENTGSDIVTSVKLSPSASLVLLGHSRGGDGTAGDGIPRVVSVVYRVGDMVCVNTRKQVGDDVNIARFHPVSGKGIVYGE